MPTFPALNVISKKVFDIPDVYALIASYGHVSTGECLLDDPDVLIDHLRCLPYRHRRLTILLSKPLEGQPEVDRDQNWHAYSQGRLIIDLNSEVDIWLTHGYVRQFRKEARDYKIFYRWPFIRESCEQPSSSCVSS